MNRLLKIVGFTILALSLRYGLAHAEPPSAGWNFGNITYGQVSNSLVLNSLSDNYGISQFVTNGTNGLAVQNLGNNDYIPENAVKNELALSGYSVAYDYNPQYAGLYASAYNQPLPTNVPLTKLSFMGLAGNPNAIQNVYVLTSEYNALSAQGQAASINGLTNGLAQTNAQVGLNTQSVGALSNSLAQTNVQVGANTHNIAILGTGLANETSARVAGDSALQGQIDATNGNVASLGNRVSDLERLKVMPEADIRFFDSRHVSAVAYDAYDATNGHNFAVGVKVMLKLGKSYEETLVEKQQKEIDELKALLEVRYVPRVSEVFETAGGR